MDNDTRTMIRNLTEGPVLRQLLRTIGTLFSVLLLIGAAFLALFLFGVDWVLRVMSMPAESYAYGTRYVMTCAVGAFAIVG